MPENSVAPHNNQQVFSDYYLDHKLPARADWQALVKPAGAVREQIAGIFARFRPSAVEAQVEKDWVYPVLEALGHTFEVQAALRTPAGTQKPDYVFYRNLAARDVNKNKTLTDVHLRAGGLAVGDAKYWDRPLDVTLASLGKSGGDAFTNKNPSYQIAFYVQHAGVDWGILTNGRKWRLYHKDSAHKLNRFYEVDLPALLEAGDPAAFLYFYAFFRREAFEAANPLGLAALLTESGDFARGIGASLKRQVYEALKHVAQGFLDYAPNALSANDPATRKAIYDNSLILLYRLLFVLYAEARELLPIREPGYRNGYSLFLLKQQVAGALDAGRTLLPTSATVWPRLRELFGIIDQGSPPLKVTTYNGGLFDSARHPFLERCAVGDAHLEHALDLLCRTSAPVTGERVFVDYRDLSERHLGTIYEGLLEFHLTELPEPEAGWTIALENDRGERKATGSYYTPDTIVKYIVEQTVGPVLREAVAGKTTDAQKIAAVLGVNVLDPAMGSGHFLVEATEYIARFLVDLAVSPEEAPALTPFPSPATVEGCPPRGSAAAPREAEEEQVYRHPSPAAGEGKGVRAAEPDITYWKRRVVQSCVYGVDLNPLAVDLAKLSLWLSTLASERPLSFLDHHLRTGNALVGARLDELARVREGATGKSKPQQKTAHETGEAAGQLTLLADDAFRQSMSLAVGNLWLIEASGAESVADVKQQEALYEAARDAFTKKWARLADLVTATHFGVAVAPGLWRPLADWALGRAITAPASFVGWGEQAEQAARARHFFHWELEFPEVFFDGQGRALGDAAGFDAVVGNPPYVRQELLAPFKPFLKETFAAYHSVADLYLYFFEQGLRLLQRGGRMAFISSGTFARANFAKSFRTVLPTLGALETIIDFGENQPFAGAEMVRPSIVVLRRGVQDGPFRSLFLSGKVPESFGDAVAQEGVDLEADALSQPEWSFQSAAGTELLAKLQSAGRKLVDVVDGKMYRGVLTGLNEAFLIDTPTRDRLVAEDPACADLIKPVLRGEDLRPWYQENEGRWLIFTRRGTNIEAYPAIKAHLEPFRATLTPRPPDLEAYRDWPGRKAGSYQWFEIQDTVDYYEAFDQPKIFWPDIAKLPRFSWDDEGKFINNKGYIIPNAEPYLLGVLQSRVAWFVVSQVCQPLRLRAGLWQYQMFTQFISRLPIPDAPDEARAAIGALARANTDEARTRYALHEKVRRRIRSDLGTPGKPLNQKLSAWWTLTFPAFRAELVKAFRQDIPLKERDDWEVYLAARQAEHARHTQTIVQNETELNARVYALFDLTADEKQTIEDSTKYRYGEV